MDWASGSWSQGKTLAEIVSRVEWLLGSKSLIKSLSNVVDWDVLRRKKVSGVGGILDWAFRDGSWGEALADIVSKARRLFRGKTLTRLLVKVVDLDVLEREMTFKVRKMLGWVSVAWSWGKALISIVAGSVSQSKFPNEF